MARRPIKEDTISHERWLVSYADFLTLLMAFFVVMYSVSQVNEGKYRALSSTLMDAFKVPPQSLKPIQVGERTSSDMTTQGITDLEVELDPEQDSMFVAPVPEEYKQVSDRIEQQFAGLVEEGLITVRGNEEWLEIELKSSLLFASGSAEASDVAASLIADISAIVKPTNRSTRVEGFTDNVPISNERYPSNWELSAARAASIVKLMVKEGIDARRISATGYGEYHPVADNATPEGRAENRRVVVMLGKHDAIRPAEGTLTTLLDSDTVTPGAPVAAEQPQQPEFHAVEMEDGRLLFTNDPARADILQRKPQEPQPAE
jgi:chemotaxis protein MotB